MTKLSQKMQERLDLWRKNVLPVKLPEKLIPNLRQSTVIRRGSKGDQGDVETLEQLEEEHRRSQTRK